MKILNIYGFLILFSSIFLGFGFHRFTPNTSILRKATESIVRSQGVRDIVVFYRDNRTDTKGKEIFSVVTNTILPIHPIRYTNISRRVRKEDPLLKTINSYTLVIIVCAEQKWTRQCFGYLQTIFIHRHPKLLVIPIINNALRDSLHKLYTTLLEFKLVHVTIWELSQSRNVSISYVPKMYLFNPFYRNYKELTSIPQEWFPNKGKDLNRHSITIYRHLRGRGFDVKVTDNNKIWIPGFEGIYLNSLVEKTKASVLIVRGGVSRDIYGYPIVLLRLYPEYRISSTLQQERMCFYLKKQSIRNTAISPWRFIGAVAIGIFLLILFFFYIVMLGADVRLGHPSNAVRLILGVSVPDEPQQLTGRVLFVFLVVACTRYASMLYTELFDMSVTQETELDFTNFEDVERSGMTLVMDATTAMVLRDMPGVPPAVLERIVLADFFYRLDYVNSKYFNNPSYALLDTEYFLAGQDMIVNGTEVMKHSKLCPIERYSIFWVSETSVIQEDFDDVILRLQEGGIPDRRIKWYDHLSEQAKGKLIWDSEDVEDDGDEEGTDDFPVLIGFLGYFLACCAFLFEVVRHRFAPRR